MDKISRMRSSLRLDKRELVVMLERGSGDESGAPVGGGQERSRCEQGDARGVPRLCGQTEREGQHAFAQRLVVRGKRERAREPWRRDPDEQGPDSERRSSDAGADTATAERRMAGTRNLRIVRLLLDGRSVSTSRMLLRL